MLSSQNICIDIKLLFLIVFTAHATGRFVEIARFVQICRDINNITACNHEIVTSETDFSTFPVMKTLAVRSGAQCAVHCASMEECDVYGISGHRETHHQCVLMGELFNCDQILDNKCTKFYTKVSL